LRLGNKNMNWYDSILKTAGSASPLSAKEIKSLRTSFQEIVEAGECNSAGGASCGVASEEAEMILEHRGGTRRCGLFYAGDGRDFNGYPLAEHCWVQLPDGTIIDNTISQFAKHIEGRWPGLKDIAIIPPQHPFAQHYQTHWSHPRKKFLGMKMDTGETVSDDNLWEFFPQSDDPEYSGGDFNEDFYWKPPTA
jgi:hypothetical protein